MVFDIRKHIGVSFVSGRVMRVLTAPECWGIHVGIYGNGNGLVVLHQAYIIDELGILGYHISNIELSDNPIELPSRNVLVATESFRELDVLVSNESHHDSFTKMIIEKMSHLFLRYQMQNLGEPLGKHWQRICVYLDKVF